MGGRFGLPAARLNLRYRDAYNQPRRYEPDFVVLTVSGGRQRAWLVKGKAQNKMDSPEVAAKAACAKDWVRAVNTSGKCPQPWGYVLAGEDAIASAQGGWDRLLTTAQVWS